MRSRPPETLLPEDTHVEAVQAWHGTDGKTRILYQLSNDEESVGRAIVFEMNGFDPDSARVVFDLGDFAESFWVASPTEFFVLEVGRTVHHFRNGAWSSALVADSMMLRIWGLDRQNAFLFGSEGNIYNYDGTLWTKMSVPVINRIQDMHGTSVDRIYAVGDVGTLLQLKGPSWHQIDLNLSNGLRAVCAASDGAVYAAGKNGTCIRFDNDERFDFAVPDNMFQCICEFKGQRYWGDDGFGVYRQNGDLLEPYREIDFAYHMSASEKLLLVISGPEVHAFDGEHWRVVELRYGPDGWGLTRVDT